MSYDEDVKLLRKKLGLKKPSCFFCKWGISIDKKFFTCNYFFGRTIAQIAPSLRMGQSPDRPLSPMITFAIDDNDTMTIPAQIFCEGAVEKGLAKWPERIDDDALLLCWFYEMEDKKKTDD